MIADRTSPAPHVVVLIHGIKTFGGWQVRLRQLVKEREPDTDVIVYRYGYFLALAFLIPPLRWLVVARFRRFLAEKSAAWTDARVDLVAHSFGTYIAARALGTLPPEAPLRIDTLVLSGAVLRPRTSFDKLLASRVRRVVNDCGSSDVWPLVAQLFSLGMGAAGRFGLTGGTGPDTGLVNRFFPFGHSGFFLRTEAFAEDAEQFMREKWLPVLAGGAVEAKDQEPARATFMTPVFILLEPAKLALLLLPILVVWGVVHAANVRERAQALVLAAKDLVETDPIGAFVLGFEADRLVAAGPGRDAMASAIDAIRAAEARRRSWNEDWTKGGLFGPGWRHTGSLALRHPELDLTVSAVVGDDEPHEITVADGESGRAFRLETPGRSRHLSALRFSRSGRAILVGRHAFLEVHELDGTLRASQESWLTKDQWVFLELLDADRILLASANEGHVILFRFGTGHDLEPLNREFQFRTHGPIVRLEVNESGDRLFVIHRSGHATYWGFDASPKDPNASVSTRDFERDGKHRGYLIPIHLFGLTEERAALAPERGMFQDLLAEERIVCGDMKVLDGATRFATGFEVGDPSVWELTDGRVVHRHDLPHAGAPVVFAGFADEGQAVTLDEAGVARVFSGDGELVGAVGFEPGPP